METESIAGTINTRGASQALIENQTRTAIYLGQQNTTQRELGELEAKALAIQQRIEVNSILRPFLDFDQNKTKLK